MTSGNTGTNTVFLPQNRPLTALVRALGSPNSQNQLFDAKKALPRVAPTFVLKYNIRTRSLADQGAIEDVLAVEDDVVPFDRADVLGAGLRQGLPW